MSMNEEEFFLDGDELNKEGQLSMADVEKVKILETMKKKIEEAIGNLNHSEKEEYRATFAVISRYVGAILEIEQLEQDPNTSEEELLEAIEKIELTVKELSFQDLKEIKKKIESVEVPEQRERDGDNDGDADEGDSSTPGEDKDFDF
jgi:hypothetical protein